MESTNKTFLFKELYNDSSRTKSATNLFFKNEKMITCNL